MKNNEWKEGIEASDIFVNMPIFPWQLIEQQSRMTGALRLAFAVLEEAVNEYGRLLTATDTRKSRLRRETEDWFLSEGREWPFSFLNLCDYIGIDAEAFRQEIRKIKKHAKELSTGRTKTAEENRPIAPDTHRWRHTAA